MLLTVATVHYVGSSTASTASMTSAATTQSCVNPTEGFYGWQLLTKRKTTHDACVLTFALPKALGSRPFGLPDVTGAAFHTGVKLRHTTTDEAGKLLVKEKSYSPTSWPGSDTMELLVKSYPLAPHGGFGAFLCSLQPGEEAAMAVKPVREVLGAVDVSSRRFAEIGMVAGGTGIAPFVQIVRSLLEGNQGNVSNADDVNRRIEANPVIQPPKLRLLFVNRRMEDILMKEELDALAESHGDKLQITYSLTQPPPPPAAASPASSPWSGATGRGSVALAREALPRPGHGTLVMVCGTDGFVETWAGAVTRVKDPVTGKKTKVQGPLKGILKEAGFDESMVYKF